MPIRNRNDDLNLNRKTVPGKLIRKPQIALDVEMNTLLINCRSLTSKLTSLSNNFKMNSATLAMLTETWFSKGNKKVAHELNILSQRDGTSFLRKDHNTRGGGVAIAFNSAKMEMKKLPLQSLKGSELEILVGRGKLHGIKKQHLVFACYIPPSYSSSQNKQFFDVLTDAISEARSIAPDAWVNIGGDWNGRSLAEVSRLFPDIAEVPSSPTRKDTTLDIIANNYCNYVSTVSTNFALEAEDGRKSDQQILQINSVLPRPRAFVWEVHQYLKTSREGDDQLVQLLSQQDWASVKILDPNNHDMALEFHRILDELMNRCYTWKKVRRRTTDKPWISDGLRDSIRRRAAVFRETGRSLRWKRLDKAIKKTLAFRKREYNKRQKERLEACGRTGQWWNISKFLVSDENPRQWAVTDLDPEKTASEIATDLSKHFTQITNLGSPLGEGDIPESEDGPGLVRLLENA